MKQRALGLWLAASVLAVSGCVSGGTVDGDVLTCPVHGTATRMETREINYGLYRFPEGYFEAEKRLFPMANTHVSGGCVVGPEKFTRVRYCAECRKAEEQWNASRPDGWKH
jgi:hypothetical protein